MTHAITFRVVLNVVIRMLVVLLMVTPTFAQAPNPPKSSAPPFTLRGELLTDPEGVDLGSYLRSVYKSIKEKALASMPASVARGDQGIVTIRLRIQKDGTLGPVSLIYSSRNKALDDNAMDAASNAAPYEHLPDKLSAPSIELRFTFYYNLAPSKAINFIPA